MVDDNKIRSMELGVALGGAHAAYLNNHFSMVGKESDMLKNSDETFNAKRYKALVESHISDIANHHKQNELRQILKEKNTEKLKEIAAENNHVSIDEVTQDMLDNMSRNDVDDALVFACNLVKGLITLYMDQFCSIEEKYEIGLL